MRKLSLAVILLGLLLAAGSGAWAAESRGPNVVVSIKPLHSLIAGIMQGVGEPQLLIQGGGSPHGYVLRPSEARLLTEAQLVVWVGHRLEGFLEKPLSTLGANARQLELAEELEGKLLPMREGGSWDAHVHGHMEHAEEDADKHGDHMAKQDHGHEEHAKEHAGHHEDGHAEGEHGEYNPHLWLNPLLAKEIVAKTAAVLIEIDPTHRQQYQLNAAQLSARLDSLHTQLKTRLAPVQNVPYVVFHDAYQYFEVAYGLNAVGSISIDPERKPGARRIAEIREKIDTLQVRCVFSEPQFEPKLVATVIEGTGARTGVLDPLGAKLPVGQESYFLLLNALADNLVSGLQK